MVKLLTRRQSRLLMDLLLETNFLLELVYGQEQATACEAILQAAEQGKLTIHLPSFCLAEQLYQFLGESNKRSEVQSSVQRALIQAARETANKGDLLRLERELSTVLEVRSQEQQARLLELSQRVAQVIEPIELGPAVWQRVTQLADGGALTLPDCVVCASVLERARELGPDKQKLFVTRDKKGFHQPAVRQMFQDVNCQVILNFEHAIAQLRMS